MPWFTPKDGGPAQDIPNELVPKALASGLYQDLDPGTKIPVTDSGGGLTGEVTPGDLASYQHFGAVPEAGAGFRARERGARLEREHGGVAGAIGTGFESAADALSLSGYGAFARKFLPDDYNEAREGRAEVHPYVDTATGIGATVVAAALSGGSSLAAEGAAGGVGLVTRAGAGIAKKLGGGIAGKVVGFTAEGVALGMAQEVHNLTIAEDEITVQRAAAALSSGALYGGLTGAFGGLFAGTVEKALIGTNKLVAESAAKFKANAAVTDDLEGLVAAGDTKGLRAAETVEKERITAGHDAERASLKGEIEVEKKAIETAHVEKNAALDASIAEEETQLAADHVEKRAAAAQSVKTYQQAVKEARPWLLTDSSANLTKSNRALRTHLNNVEGLAENPGKALSAVQAQSQALKEIAADAPKSLARLAKEDAKLAEKLAAQIAEMPPVAAAVEGAEAAAPAADVQLTGKLASRYADHTEGARVGRGGIAVTREEAARLLEGIESGEIGGARKAALEKLPDLIKHVDALKAEIKAASVAEGKLSSRALEDMLEARAAPKVTTSEKLEQLRADHAAPRVVDSPRMGDIANAREAIALRKATPTSLGEQIAQGASFSLVTGAVAPLLGPLAPVAPVIGAWASKRIVSRLFGGLARATVESTERTAKAVASFVETGTRAVKVAPTLATKVLTSVTFGAAPAAKAVPLTEKVPPLLAAFRKREAELREQVTIGADGKPMMRPAARRKLAGRLAAVAAISPPLADKLETHGARRIEFLASKLPRRPDLGMRIGADNWRPSDMEMRTVARYVAACEDPIAIVERLAHGTVTPEDAEAMREVYPEIFADVMRRIIEALPQIRGGSLPYQRIVGLSIFSGVAVDPAMNPRILRPLQGNFAAEEGTESGTAPPMAAPQYASIKKSIPEPTPGQSRAG